MRRAFQSVGFLLCVLISVGGAYNVLADNADVELLAQEIACGGSPTRPADAPTVGGTVGGCHAQKTRMERTPLAQTFDFATGKKQVTVRCARAAVLAGDYTCELR
jgi:hypothetical protein